MAHIRRITQQESCGPRSYLRKCDALRSNYVFPLSAPTKVFVERRAATANLAENFFEPFVLLRWPVYCCSVSLFSVVRASSPIEALVMLLDPAENFIPSKAPVFAKPISRQPLPGPLAHTSVDPRHRHVQHLGNLTDAQKSPHLSLACGRALWRDI
jgi:hypothetical protein